MWLFTALIYYRAAREMLYESGGSILGCWNQPAVVEGVEVIQVATKARSKISH